MYHGTLEHKHPCGSTIAFCHSPSTKDYSHDDIYRSGRTPKPTIRLQRKDFEMNGALQIKKKKKMVCAFLWKDTM